MHVYVYRDDTWQESNTHFSQFLPNDDIEIMPNEDKEIINYKHVTSPRGANPKAITPGGP